MTQPDAARVERGPITEVKRFALGMADLLERQGFTIAAAELRRLYDLAMEQQGKIYALEMARSMEQKTAKLKRDALLEALKSTHAMLQATLFIMQDPEARSIAKAQLDKNRAAIKAAEENA